MLCFRVTLAHHYVPPPAHTLSRAVFLPSWLKAHGYKLTSAFLTPFFPALAHHVFNPSGVYHLQRTGEGVPLLTVSY
jgi:hypothetical protein